MPFAQMELNGESLESDNRRQKADCDRCGSSATLSSVYLYRPRTSTQEQQDDQSPSPVVMTLHCPVCGPRTQIKAADRGVSR